MGPLADGAAVVIGATGAGWQGCSSYSVSLVRVYCALPLLGQWPVGFNDVSHRVLPQPWEKHFKKMLAVWILGPLIFLIVTIKAERTLVSARTSKSSTVTSKQSPGW